MGLSQPLLGFYFFIFLDALLENIKLINFIMMIGNMKEDKCTVH